MDGNQLRDELIKLLPTKCPLCENDFSSQEIYYRPHLLRTSGWRRMLKSDRIPVGAKVGDWICDRCVKANFSAEEQKTL